MLKELALVHSLEMSWETLSQDWVCLGHYLHNLLLWMAVDEAEILLELVVCRLEFKVCGDVTAQPIHFMHKK